MSLDNVKSISVIVRPAVSRPILTPLFQTFHLKYLLMLDLQYCLTMQIRSPTIEMSSTVDSLDKWNQDDAKMDTRAKSVIDLRISIKA